MRQVIQDTVGLLAIWDEDDQWHTQAEAAWKTVIESNAVLINSSYVMLECGNAVARTRFRIDVDETRRRLENAGTLLHPTQEQWTEAWTRYVRREAAEAGIVDQISCVVMRALGITDAFTNDGHFRAAGFHTLF